MRLNVARTKDNLYGLPERPIISRNNFFCYPTPPAHDTLLNNDQHLPPLCVNSENPMPPEHVFGLFHVEYFGGAMAVENFI